MRNSNTREEILDNIQRIVVKVGTSTLTTEDGHLDIEKIKKIVLELSNLQDKGYDVILVTSGAVGAGMGLLNISEKPKTLAEKQMLSAVGQVSLMQIYQTLFKEHNKIIGQLLLTKEEFSNRKRYLNMRNVCNAFLKRKIIPIINENDAIIGASICHYESHEMINLLALAINQKIKSKVLKDFIYTHPIFTETLNDILG